MLLSHCCPTLCHPIDGSPLGSPIPGILQARTPEWVAISFSNAGKWKMKVKSLSCVWPSATPWTAAFQASLSMGFSRQEYWSGLPLLSPELQPTKHFCSGDCRGKNTRVGCLFQLEHRGIELPGIEPTSPVVPALQMDSLPLSYQGSPRMMLAIGF